MAGRIMELNRLKDLVGDDEESMILFMVEVIGTGTSFVKSRRRF